MKVKYTKLQEGISELFEQIVAACLSHPLFHLNRSRTDKNKSSNHIKLLRTQTHECTSIIQREF